jgi:hypothetical protein
MKREHLTNVETEETCAMLANNAIWYALHGLENMVVENADRIIALRSQLVTP